MAKIQKGVCKNYDNCDKADNKEVQDIKSGEQFVCEECGKKLVESSVKGTGGGSKMKPVIIAIAVVLLIACGVFFWQMWHKPSPLPTITVEPDTTEHVTAEPVTVEPDTVKPVTAEPVITEPVITEPAKVIENGYGTLNLGYAIYTGDIKNGKPHGNGTLEYKKSQKIISSKDYVASPGEKVIGSFRDGKINLATWYQKDGNQVVIK